MMRIASIILNNVAALLMGCFGAVWFGNGGYGAVAWVGFVLGYVSWFAVIVFVAMMWFIVIGAVDKDTYWKGE